MRIGTKSVLFGAHCFFIHPWFVALGWWKLYGFPWQPWLWVAFLLHDIGYLGKPNMDGPEGEEHPWTGAHILYWLQGAWLFLTRYAWKRSELRRQPIHRLQFRRRWAWAHLSLTHERVIWGNEALFHSRYLAKRYGAQPSRLCMADKLAIALTPAWLYLPMVRLTGEVREYMAHARHRIEGNEQVSESEKAKLLSGAEYDWYRGVQEYMVRWVAGHKDGRSDTWTSSARKRATLNDQGVWR